MHKFPLAVIGAGVMGRSLIDRLLKTPGFALVGVTETNPAALPGWAKRCIPNPGKQQSLAASDAQWPTSNLPCLAGMKEKP